MTLIKKTTVREYNAEGKVTKETVTEEYSAAHTPALPNPHTPAWPNTGPRWGDGIISNGIQCDTIVVDGVLSPGQINDDLLAAVKSHN